MPDASDWSFSRSAPVPPTPPTPATGVTGAPATTGPGGKPADPGAKPLPTPEPDRKKKGKKKETKPGQEAAAPEGAGAEGGKRSGRKRTLIRVGIAVGGAVVVVGLLVAIYLVLSSGSDDAGDLSGYSATPADYVPEQVDGRDVRTNAPALDEISKRFMAARGLEGSNLELAAGMVPQGPRQPPQSVVLVLGGDGAGGLMGSFQGDTDVREDTTIDADGVEVRLVRVDDDAFPEVWTAIASPREDVAVVAMSFSGGRRGAEDMARAALERGKQ